MKIVIDTNILFNNWSLDNTNFDLLKSYIKKTNSSLIIPKIVLEELINIYEKDLKKYVNQYHETLEKLHKYLFFANNLKIEIEIEKFCQQYREIFLEKLKDFNGKIIDYKDIPHEDIVQRELHEKAPYKYRDILIWETILRRVINLENFKEKTVLITNDSHFDKEKLLNEIKIDDEPEKYFEILNSLKEFIDKYVKPTLEESEQIKKQIQENSYRLFSVQNWIENNYNKIIEILEKKIEFIKYEEPFSLYEIDIEVSDIFNVIEFEVLDVYFIEKEKILVDLNLILELELELFIFKPDAYRILNDKSSWISISNFDWNKHYALGYAYISLPVFLSIIINTENGEVESFQVDLSEFFGFCPKCGRAILSDTTETCYYCGKKFF